MKGLRLTINHGILKFFLVSFFMIFLCGLAIFVQYDLFDSSNFAKYADIIPPDSVRYIDFSTQLDDLISQQNFLKILIGSLNWISIPFVYYLINEYFGGAPLIFLFVNSVLIAHSYQLFVGHINLSWGVNKFLYSFAAYLFVQPYLFSYVLCPNKDVFVLWGLLFLAKLLGKSNRIRLIILIPLLSAMKIQIAFSMIIRFVLMRSQVVKIILIVFLCLVYAYLRRIGFGVDMNEFYENTPEDVNSAGLMLLLDGYVNEYFSILVVSPVRIFLNLFVGLSLGKILTASGFVNVVFALTTFWLGVVWVFNAIIYVKKRNLYLVAESKVLLVSYFLVLSLIPFLQSRYYWFSIPFGLIGIYRYMRLK